ncbi:MAG: spore germination protein [Thermosediminibacterales bacterium]|nr:spore germination protein [Thermosediminibacterales bacterium]MDK2836264.1 spore germination protein [Thermosediminibacterales bacterium]
MKTCTKVVTVFLVVSLILPTIAFAQTDIKVVLDGRKIDFDVEPLIENNRTIVPFRQVAEAIGARVDWDGATRSVYAYKNATRVVLQIDNKTAQINGREIELDMPAVIRRNRTMVPLRFFAEAFGADVVWHGDSRTVVISTGPKPMEVMGYYYSKSYSDFMDNHKYLTSTALKWYTFDENGGIVTKDTNRWILVPEGYKEVLNTAKMSGVKTYAMVFESSSKRLNSLLNDKSKRNQLIKELVNLTLEEGFDGINIDFEFLKENDRDVFNTFVKDLAESLHKKQKTLSLSVPVKTEKADWFKGYDYETLGRYADVIVLMAYDKNPAAAVPQAPIEWVEEVVDYAVARIPSYKILLGIGFYGYDWANGRKKTVLHTRRDFDYGVQFIDEIIEKYGSKPVWDEKSQMMYMEYTDENGLKHVMWYESEESTWEKIKLAKRKGLGGIAIWRLGYTTSGFWNVIKDNI